MTASVTTTSLSIYLITVDPNSKRARSSVRHLKRRGFSVVLVSAVTPDREPQPPSRYMSAGEKCLVATWRELATSLQEAQGWLLVGEDDLRLFWRARPLIEQILDSDLKTAAAIQLGYECAASWLERGSPAWNLRRRILSRDTVPSWAFRFGWSRGNHLVREGGKLQTHLVAVNAAEFTALIDEIEATDRPLDHALVSISKATPGRVLHAATSLGFQARAASALEGTRAPIRRD